VGRRRVKAGAIVALSVTALLLRLLPAQASGFDYLTAFVGSSHPTSWQMMGDFHGDLNCNGNSQEFEDLVSTNSGGDICGSPHAVAGPIGTNTNDVRYAGIQGGPQTGNGSCCAQGYWNGTTNYMQFGAASPADNDWAVCIWLLPTNVHAFGDQAGVWSNGLKQSGDEAVGSVNIVTLDNWAHIGVYKGLGNVGDRSWGAESQVIVSVPFTAPGGGQVLGKWSQLCVEYAPPGTAAGQAHDLYPNDDAGGAVIAFWINDGAADHPQAIAGGLPQLAPQSADNRYSQFTFTYNLGAVWGLGVWGGATGLNFQKSSPAPAITQGTTNNMCPTQSGQQVSCSVYDHRPWPAILWESAYGLFKAGENGSGNNALPGANATCDTGSVGPLSGKCKALIPPIPLSDCSSPGSIWNIGADIGYGLCQLGNVITTVIDGVITGLNYIIDLFEPSSSLFDPITLLATEIGNKVPFAYAKQFGEGWIASFGAGSASGNVTVASSGGHSFGFDLGGSSFAVLDPFRTLIAGIIYASGAASLFYIVKHELANA